MTSEVAIVGAGLIGVGIAYELAKRGARVTVFDRAEPMRAASWAGAGMLAPYSEELPDPPLFALCRDSLDAYPAFVEELGERTGLDPQFRRCGTLHVALTAAQQLALEIRAPSHRAAGGDVRLLDRSETLAREPAVARSVMGSLFIANEAQIDNRRLGRALCAACRALGVRFNQADDIALEHDSRRVRGLRTARGFVSAGSVVNAAGAWAAELPGVPAPAQIPVFPVAGEMLALAVPQGFARALIWHGHTYLVPRDDGRLLVGATVLDRGYDRRVTAAGLRDLLAAALLAAPSLGDFAVVESWAGLRPGTPDGRPYLGQTSLEGYFVAAGHYRNGILLTPLTARTIADLVLSGRTATSLTAFAPGRHGPESARAVTNVWA